jgi:HK97 family phage major capsid protein
MADVDQVKAVLEGIQSKLMNAVSERDSQIREFGQANERNAAEISRLSKEYAQAQADMKASVDAVADDVRQVMAKMEAVKTLTPTERKSIVGSFLTSSEYQEYKANGFHKQSRPFYVGGSLGAIRGKATFTGASLADTPAYMYEVDRFAEYVKDPDRPQFVRELLPTFGVSTGAVEFVREVEFTNNADMVPEFAATDSGNKPESALSFEIVTVPVRTMAHFIPVTRQIVDDETQLRGYIENRLLYGLKLVEDQQILYGSGVGNDLNGILTDPGIQSYTQTSTETMIDAIRKGITKSYVKEYRPTGIIMNHQDWETIELTKGGDEHYIWVNVTTTNGSRLWGLPVVATNAIQKGTILLGDFQRGSVIHDRQNASIRISDSHADFFTKNLWALLAEERIAQSILRPNAFVEITAYEEE